MDTELRPLRHRFELGGGSITGSRMTAGPIVEHFQPLKDVLLGLRPCPIPSMRLAHPRDGKAARMRPNLIAAPSKYAAALF